MKRTTKILTAGLVAGAGIFAIAVVSHPHGPGAFARGMDGAGGWHRGGHHGWRGHGAHKGAKHHGMRKMLKRLKRMDADNNGEVTETEFLQRREQRFALMDADKSNTLSADELVSPKRERRVWRGKRFVKRMDTNKDGKVSKDEMLAVARARFAEHDLDGDGKVTRSDMPPKSKHHRRRGHDEARDDTSASEDVGEKIAEDDEKGRRGRHGKHRRWHRRVRTLEQVEKRITRRFEKADVNKDGFIEADEFAQRGKDRMEFAKRKRMHRLDANKDGTVSQDEFMKKARDRFAIWDLDDSGAVTAEDLPPALAQRWKAK